ncbi:hypothetical protein ABHN09_18715 [Bacillus paramobilis]
MLRKIRNEQANLGAAPHHYQDNKIKSAVLGFGAKALGNLQ